MKNIYNFVSLPDFFKSELARRKIHNPSYSLRAFARDLGISSSRLSEYIKQNDRMSPETAARISNSLQLSENERKYLSLLIEAGGAGTSEVREKAKKEIALIRDQKKFAISKSGFEGLLSTWYYIPLVELLSLCSRTTESIASDLGITVEEVMQATKNLELAGYIRPIGKRGWKKSTPFLQIESAQHKNDIKNYHKHAIANGAKALNQPIESRKFLSTVLGIRKTSIEEARRELESFNKDFIAKYATENSAETVYCMNLQFFEFENLGTK